MTIIEANDPWDAERQIHQRQIAALNNEIIRLKIKCGEDFTSDELLEGFGDQERHYKIVRKAPSP